MNHAHKHQIKQNGVEVQSVTPRLLVTAGLVWLAPEIVLVQRRSASATHGAGLLEFPGGKVEPGESPRAALFRELHEEWGRGAQSLQIGPVVDVLHHIYESPSREVVLIVYHVNADAWGPSTWQQWVEVEGDTSVVAYGVHQLPRCEFLPADQTLVEAIRNGQHRNPWVYRASLW